jgi:hypothetical protein
MYPAMSAWKYLRGYAERLRTWQTTTPLVFHALEDYDETMQLTIGQQPDLAGPVDFLPEARS